MVLSSSVRVCCVRLTPGSKLRHFEKLHRKTGIPYDQMVSRWSPASSQLPSLRCPFPLPSPSHTQSVLVRPTLCTLPRLLAHVNRHTTLTRSCSSTTSTETSKRSRWASRCSSSRHLVPTASCSRMVWLCGANGAESRWRGHERRRGNSTTTRLPYILIDHRSRWTRVA